MRSARGLQSFAIGLATLWLAACAADPPRETWTDPAWHGPPLTKFVVVAVQRSDGRRRLWEDGMALAFKAKGIDAIPSYQLVPSSQPSIAEISEAAARGGYSGLIASHLISTSTNFQQGMQEPQRMVPEVVADSSGKLHTIMRTEYGPGEISSETVADYQTDVYATGQGGKLVWTAASRVRELSTVKSVAQRISNTVIPSLQASGVIAGTGTGNP